MFFVYTRVLGLLNHCFDRLDQKKIKNKAYLSYLRIFYLNGIDVSCRVNFQH